MFALNTHNTSSDIGRQVAQVTDMDVSGLRKKNDIHILVSKYEFLQDICVHLCIPSILLSIDYNRLSVALSPY